MGPEGYVVRPLRRDDVDEFAALHVEVWREAYAGIMRADALAALDPVTRADAWQARFDAIETEGLGPVPVVVAVTPDGALAGFASAGPSRDADAPVPMELYALNVLAEHRGTGVADLLLAAAIGDAPASLWVVDVNERARAFYRRHGFEADGTTQNDDEYGVRELRLVRG